MDSGTKWMYLNGHVGFGDWHHQIADQLAARAGVPDHDAKAISNYALVNAIPAVEGHDLAWGHLHHNIPVFWNTNVDRSAVDTAVRNGIGAADRATRDNGGRAIGGDSLDSDQYNQNGGNVAVASFGWRESMFGGTPSGLELQHYGPESKVPSMGVPTVNYEGTPQEWFTGGRGGHLINAVDSEGNIRGALHYNRFPRTVTRSGLVRPEQLYVSEMHVAPQLDENGEPAVDHRGQPLRNTQLAYEMAREMVGRHPGVPIASVLAEPRLAPLVERYNRSLGWDTQTLQAGDTMKGLTPIQHAAKTSANGGTAFNYVMKQLGGTRKDMGNDEINGQKLPDRIVTPDGREVEMRLQMQRDPYFNGGQPTMYLTHIHSYPERTGLGTEVMNHLKDYADQTGLKFQVHMPADAAHPFYDKMDWLEHPTHYDYHYIPGGKQSSVFGNLAPWYIADGFVIVGNFGQTAPEIGWEEGQTWGWLDLEGHLTAHVGSTTFFERRTSKQAIVAAVERRYEGLPVSFAESDSNVTGWWAEG